MSWWLKNPNPAWKFPNGDYVFHGGNDESQIDPSSPEGKQIQALWDYQANVLTINDDQKKTFCMGHIS